MMKNKSFAVIIMSHKRANIQLTYDTLMRMNYTGKVYIIVDDEDDEIELYKEKYGDIIKVFNKDEMLKYVDTLDNFNNKTNALLPSMYAKILAEQEKLDYYMKMDDDIFSIRQRYVEDNKLKGKDIINIDEVFDLFINYMKKTKIDCLSFGNEGGFIGGANGKFKNGMGKNNTQTFLIKTSSNIKFLGTRNEDFNTTTLYSKLGKQIYEVYRIGIKSPERASNKGGLQDDYSNVGMYIPNFYSLIVAPYCCKIAVKNNNFILKKKWDRFAPLLISEEYKK